MGESLHFIVWAREELNTPNRLMGGGGCLPFWLSVPPQTVGEGSLPSSIHSARLFVPFAPQHRELILSLVWEVIKALIGH